VTLSWNAVSGATSYNIFMGTQPSNESDMPQVGTIAGTSAAVPNLINESRYYFKLVAVNAAGPSPLSAEVSAIPLPPPVVGTVTAIAGNQQVSLSWLSSEPVTSYSVSIGTTPGGEKTLARGITSTSYVAKGLRNGVTYYFTVTGTNNAGTGVSPEVSAMPVIGTLPEPAISPNGGFFHAPRTVHIGNIRSGSQVFYTLDGSTPTSSSALYEGPITLSATCTLKAIAIERLYANSLVAAAAFEFLP
jgi:hypothetical protein